MKVSDLIEALENHNPDAEVYLMTQQSWPFEYGVQGVVAREDMVEEEDEGGARYGQGEEPGDVFLVEGSQLRYGNKRAWDAC